MFASFGRKFRAMMVKEYLTSFLEEKEADAVVVVNTGTSIEAVAGDY